MKLIFTRHPPFHGDNNYVVFERILAGEVLIPSSFDPLAADLISKLLVVDITQRLGCIRGGAESVKAHPWFAGIDWVSLVHKRQFGPIHPKVSNANDTSNFFDETPVSTETPIFTGDQDIFKDF